MTEFEAYCEANGNFMQSERWAKVKRNWQSEFLTVRRGGRVVGTMLILIKKLPLSGSAILYAPRGPVCDPHDRETLRELTEKAEDAAKRYHACFLKIDPLIDVRDTAAIESFRRLGFTPHMERVGYENIQCRENFVLDIAGKTPDEVFGGFKPKWRYNIRLSEKRGVICGFYGEEKLDDFCALMAMTAKRDGFSMRGEDYFRNLLHAMGEHAGLCLTYLGDEPLSGALYIEYGGVFTYLYGCSSDTKRSCMPNYLMHRTMIQKAIGDGCRVYDFGGVPYWYDDSHRNYGVYRFKRGFGGEVVTYIGELDKVYKPWLYRLYNFLWRRKKCL